MFLRQGGSGGILRAEYLLSKRGSGNLRPEYVF
jgi:hypothetical protein